MILLNAHLQCMSSAYKIRVMYLDMVDFAAHFTIHAIGFQKYYILPVRASEQGNVIGSVCIYICVQKKFVISELGI